MRACSPQSGTGSDAAGRSSKTEQEKGLEEEEQRKGKGKWQKGRWRRSSTPLWMMCGHVVFVRTMLIVWGPMNTFEAL
jgi:hypothetical protein